MKLSTHDRAWYARRVEGFGGSEAPGIVGVSRWTGAREIIEHKARRIIPDPDAPERLRLRLGRDMEPILLEHLWETLTERNGYAPRPWRPAETREFRSRRHPFMTASPDGFLGDALVELKTDEYGYEPWGDEDGDWLRVVPRFYGCQVQHNLEVTGRRRAYLFVQVGYHEQRLYEIPRDDAYIADLVDVEAQAWACVEACRARLAADADADLDDLLPARTGRELADDLKRRFKTSDGLLLPATSEQEQIIGELRMARAARRESERVEASIEDRIKGIIGLHDGLSSGLGTVTWRKSADSPKVGHEQIAAAYRGLAEVMGTWIPDPMWTEIRAENPAIDALFAGASGLDEVLDLIVGMHTGTKKGGRPFNVPDAWDRQTAAAAA